jgi:hypothetical protein
MRSDMHKVIVESPRSGSALPSIRTALRFSSTKIVAAVDAAEDFDSGPRRASSARRDKELNENLAPLRRYLMGQIGRPWRKVYGEIRQSIDARSAIGLHVLQHLEDFVSLHTALEDGVVVCARRWCRRGPVSGLYVHPVSGLLRFSKYKPSLLTPRSDDPEPNFVRVNANVEYEKIDGYWYRMEYEMSVSSEGASMRVLILKRQCDRKTIRRIEGGEMGRVIGKGRP